MSCTLEGGSSEPGIFGNGSTSVRPLCVISMKPSSMSMFGVPYSPIVPSLIRCASGAWSRIAHSSLSEPIDVVLLGRHRVVDAAHRPRRARLLAVVDDRVRLEVDDDVGCDERVLGQVADVASGSSCRTTSRHAAMRSSRATIGVSESPPISSTQRRRAKLSTTATSWPRPENRIAVGQPR